jgi:hypothetical protein
VPETAAQIVHTEMMRAMGRSLLALQGGVKKYPKKLNPRWVRTGTLGRSVTSSKAPGAISKVRRVPGGVEGRWGSNVKYAPWVIDRDRQRDYHRDHGWWTLQDEAKRMVPKVRKEFEAASTRIANKLGPRWTKTIVIEVAL